MTKILRGSDGERGQILAISAIMLAMLLGLVAMVVDVGIFKHEQQDLQKLVDAASLAGAQELPDDGALAEAVALQYAQANDPDLDPANIDIDLYCLVGDDDANGQPDASYIPASCDPGGNASFTCDNGSCYSLCVASEGDKCNIIVVGAEANVPFFFAPAIGITDADTGVVQAAACRGSCGSSPAVPLDLVIVIDRTGSMSSSELQDAKDAARAVLELYDPNLQHIALAVLGASDPSDLCGDEDPDAGGTWLAVPLSNDYKNPDGTLNESSLLVNTIDCLNNSSQGTNLGSPIQDLAYGRPDALSHLASAGRADVKKAILLFTDGAANQPEDDGPGIYEDNSCLYARDMAAAAKALDIEVFSIGYGLESADCGDDDDPYDDVRVTRLLADMATDSLDETGCDTSSEADFENTDGDHFFCETDSDGLAAIFQQAAEQLIESVRLVRLPF